MEDYSNLKGSGAVIPLSERIWGVQKKRKTGDRNPQNGRRPRKEVADEEGPETDLGRPAAPGEERWGAVRHPTERRRAWR